MQVRNLFADVPDQSPEEVFDELLRGGPFKLGRIISSGQSTPPDQWYDQEQDEWVILLSGGARLRFADSDETIELHPGDCLNIPAHVRHRVEWTDPKQRTVWLALHYEATDEATDEPPPQDADRKPRLRFSLLSLMAFSTALCVFFAYTRFFLAVAGLFLATLVFLALFILLVQLPVHAAIRAVTPADIEDDVESPHEG